MSDDGSTAVVVIAMLGSPFSPAYARARARDPLATEPLDFSAFNVSVSRPGASLWALTERTSRSVARDASSLAIGSSSMRWTESGSVLRIDVDERSAPWNRPVRGHIRFEPTFRTRHAVSIDGHGDHLWWPLAPFGRVEVTLEEPALRFTGSGYLDANAGRGPLEESFARWSWARVSGDDGVAITYDVVTRAGRAIEHGFCVDPSGLHGLAVTERGSLGLTRFGLARTIRVPAGHRPRLLRTVEDGPFYARSLVESAPDVRGVHEVVSLDRFASSWVRFLLPFRMRREAA